MGNSGVTANTAALDDFIRRRRRRDLAPFSSRLKTITAQVYEMQEAIKAGDLEKVGAIMTENHKVLIEMGLSHEKMIYLTG